MAFKGVVDQAKCKGCEECGEARTAQVFEMQEEKSVPGNDDKCFGCERCGEVCEESAITVADLRPDLSETAGSLLRDIL